MSVIRGYRTSDQLKDLYDQFGEEDDEQLKADVQDVLKTGAGRRVLMAILCKDHVFSTIGERGEHSHQVMIEIGRHNLAQEILAIANKYDYKAVAKAMVERNEILADRNKRIEQLKSKLKGDRSEY